MEAAAMVDDKASSKLQRAKEAIAMASGDRSQRPIGSRPARAWMRAMVAGHGSDCNDEAACRQWLQWFMTEATVSDGVEVGGGVDGRGGR